MNKLYYVAGYSFKNNDWMRKLITVSSREEADGETIEAQFEHQTAGTDYKVRTVCLVCTTNEVVCMEV